VRWNARKYWTTFLFFGSHPDPTGHPWQYLKRFAGDKVRLIAQSASYSPDRFGWGRRPPAMVQPKMSAPACPLLSGYSPAVTVHTTIDLPAESHWAVRFPLYPETIREYLFPVFGGPADFRHFHCMVNSFAYDRMSHEAALITPYFIRNVSIYP
jgi:hypothetical protein